MTVSSTTFSLSEITERNSEFLVKTRFLVISTCHSSHFALNGEVWKDGPRLGGSPAGLWEGEVGDSTGPVGDA